MRETQRAVTPFGGVAVFVAYLRKIDLAGKIRRHMPVHWRSANQIDPTVTFTSFLIAVLVGILEVSTKSDRQRGQRLSAFYLKVKNDRLGEIPLECAFQGSKVFERGGPYTDLYGKEVREAKKDPRLREAGPLIGFAFDGYQWPLEPKTAFYDWLYAGCIFPHREWATKLYGYGGFSDIEFNPYRSINCQARSIALFLSLLKRGQLDQAMRSPSQFTEVLLASEYRPQLRSDDFAPEDLFATRK